jgi:hypothetical protein
MLWLVLVLAGMVGLSSYIRSAAARARAELAGRRRVRVSITIAGPAMASRAEMRERFAVEDEIQRRGIGATTDGGSGNGAMWIEVALHDPETGEEAIANVLRECGIVERAAIKNVDC